MAKVWIGAENIVSSLGLTAADNYAACLQNRSGIAAHEGIGLNGETLYVSRMKDVPNELPNTASRILQMLYASVKDALSQTSLQLKNNKRVALILSTTKGDIEALEQGSLDGAALSKLVEDLSKLIGHEGEVSVLSNACISGAAAIILAHDMVHTKRADHVIVTGADVVSRFTLTGFQSLHAISHEAARPFCKTRKGVSLGEAAATVIVSNDNSIFKGEAFDLLGGSTSNDANHISGPSRTGEGLYRAITKTLNRAGVSTAEIDFISAHGTGTLYNDDMESVAFNRAGLKDTPLNSFKGYFGHTLGAAGVLEVALCMQTLRNNTMLKNMGMVEAGTVEQVNVLTENVSVPVKTILKTASGFGGCNAALLIQNNNA